MRVKSREAPREHVLFQCVEKSYIEPHRAPSPQCVTIVCVRVTEMVKKDHERELKNAINDNTSRRHVSCDLIFRSSPTTGRVTVPT